MLKIKLWIKQNFSITSGSSVNIKFIKKINKIFLKLDILVHCISQED